MLQHNAQSIVKPNEADHKREDRIFIDQENGLYALADGAGGMGVFASDWAEYLLQQLPKKPFQKKDDFLEWLNLIAKEFKTLKQTDLQALPSDVQDKFEAEGSLSTLVAIWIDQEKQQFHFLSCGDSALLRWHTKTETLESSVPYPEFMEHPFLLNCNKPYQAEKVVLATYPLQTQETLILTSDALAQYILATYLLTHPNPKNNQQIKIVEDDYVALSQYTIDLKKANINELNFINDVLNPLEKSLTNETDFKQHLYQINQQKLLNFDDYSLIILEQQ